MLSRCLSLRAAWPLAPGALLLLFASIAAIHVEDRVGLGPDVLTRSRGSNPGNILARGSCNTLSGHAPCFFNGAACFTCSTASYTDVAGGAGGYFPGVPAGGTCGGRFQGTCNAALTCVAGVAQGACNAPPSPPTIQ